MTLRRWFWTSTALFWLGLAGFWVAPLWLAPEQAASAAPVRAAASAPASANRPAAAEPVYSLAELARHARAEDCWMAIDGAVFDVTAYLPRHPADPALLLAWCGKEASQAYKTKTRGRPHSPYADSLLPAYRIGRLEGAAR